MSQEENIRKKLETNFNYLAGKVRLQRPRRVSLEIDFINFAQVFDFTVNQLGFSHLISITGLDEQDKLGFIYHLSQGSGIVLNLKISVPKDSSIRTIISYFPGAEIYERELVDLLGARITGLPEGNRYPLTDDWPKDEYPLRKDWKAKK